MENDGDSGEGQGESGGGVALPVGRREIGQFVKGAGQRIEGLRAMARGEIAEGAKTYAAGDMRATAAVAPAVGTVVGAKVGGAAGAARGGRFGRAVGDRLEAMADDLRPGEKADRGPAGMPRVPRVPQGYFEPFAQVTRRGMMDGADDLGADATMSIGGRS